MKLIKVRLFISLGQSFHLWPDKQSVQKPHTRGSDGPVRPWNLCSGFSWSGLGSDAITGSTAAPPGGDGGARLQGSSAEKQRSRSQTRDRWSVREKWSEVNRKRLIYTAVITPAERRGSRCRGGGGEQSDAWGPRKDASLLLAGVHATEAKGWREETGES